VAELESTLRKVVPALRDAGMPFLLAGSAACCAYGGPPPVGQVAHELEDPGGASCANRSRRRPSPARRSRPPRRATRRSPARCRGRRRWRSRCGRW